MQFIIFHPIPQIYLASLRICLSIKIGAAHHRLRVAASVEQGRALIPVVGRPARPTTRLGGGVVPRSGKLIYFSIVRVRW